MSNTKCRECGCPHTTVYEHVTLSDRFYLVERHCDNCENIWLSIEKQQPSQQPSERKKTDSKNWNPEEHLRSIIENKSTDDQLENKFRELALATRNTFLQVMGGLSSLDKKIDESSKQYKLMQNEVKKLTKILKSLEGKD